MNHTVSTYTGWATKPLPYEIVFVEIL